MKRVLISVMTLTMMFGIMSGKVQSVQAAATSFQVSVTSSKVTINVNGYKTSGTIYGYDANSYAKKDSLKGISKDLTNTGSFKVGSYTKGKSQTYSFDRYTKEGKDLLYSKYYLLSSSGKIIKGPVYATKITSVKKKIAFTQNTKKGLYNENSTNMSYAKDLGVSSITVNLDLASLMYVNSHPEGSIAFKSQGKTYYFDASMVANYDAMISAASKKSMNVIAIIAAWKTSDTNRFSSSLRYKSSVESPLLGTNTSNDIGRDEYIAMMEFLANRYSKSKSKGLINTYVISNEIDFTPYFYNCKSLNTFMAEYERSLRLANLAVKKYAGDANVAVPFTHYWNGDENKLGKENSGYSLKPYQMLNWLAKTTNAQGAYDWAIAPHIYSSLNTKSNFLKDDSKRGWVNGNYKTSKQLTFTNVEILQKYLSTSALKYNGKIRFVYLTESGVSSSSNSTKAKNEQAASLAYVYLKIANLSCIKSFNYYRLQDHKAESKHHLSIGLLTTAGEKKPAYTVYKNIDTYNMRTTANKYLKYLSFYKNGKTYYSVANGKIKSYQTPMSVFSGYKWSFSFRNALKSSLKKNDPGMIYNVKASKKTKTAMTISYRKAVAATGYRIKVNGKTKVTTKKTSARITGLKSKKSYKITVQAYKTVKGKKHYGFTTSVTVKTK